MVYCDLQFSGVQLGIGQSVHCQHLLSSDTTFVDATAVHFDSVWRGDLCENCGRCQVLPRADNLSAILKDVVDLYMNLHGQFSFKMSA